MRAARALLATAIAVLALPGVASATVYTVTTTADHADKFCDADCSLRDAVIAAGSGDSISLPAGHYALSDGELTLNTDTITGAGARTTSIDGGATDRVLYVTGDSGASQVSGVTVMRGNGVGTVSSGQGGGIYITAGARLVMLNSTVAGNTARATGGGVTTAGTFTMIGGTISGNSAGALRSVGRGGGVSVAGTGLAQLGNVTVSGNSAVAQPGTSEGGGIYTVGRATLINATIANNSATSGRALWQAAPAAAGGPTVQTTLSNTILAATAGAACAGPGVPAPSAITSDHTLAGDDSCQLTGAGDMLADPRLGALANNGGPTDTQALLPTSPAINAGSNCAATDQRGITRPQGACDVGAFEYRAPTLTVVTGVINDAGGTLEAADFTVHVRTGGADVKGSPQPGSDTGTPYTLVAGTTYQVTTDPVAGYSRAVGGDCDGKGLITLQEGENRTCTVTANDGAAALNVITEVVNDDGGTRQQPDFSIHVRSGATDVPGSPQPGSATGTPYSVPAGTYTVAAAAMPGYMTTTSGDCDGGGGVTLAIGQSKTCTVTANDVAPTLKVITTVVNDSGGALTPAGYTVHVRKGAADVSGSPKPGSASGTTYTLAAGTYSVAPNGVAGYTTAIGGACAANGSVTLQPGDAKTCTVSGNDNAVVRQQQLPPPEPGKNVNALPESGTVMVKLPGTDEFVPLDEDAQIPLGTIVDVRKGRVTIVATDDEAADFYGGIFKLGQTKGAKPITVVTLVEKLSCPKKQASTAAKKKRKRRLWGDGKGRFRTKGKHSAATVVGTKWLVEDRCTSTLTRVVRGRVSVRDFVKNKTVIVKAGKKYVARKRA